MRGPKIPSLDRAAFLLDLDGTLLDIAPTPDAVVVAPGLAEALLRLRSATGNALAFVTGRPIAQVDALFPATPYAVAGEHGTALRAAPDAEILWTDLPDPPADWEEQGRDLVRRHPGAVFEPKRHGFVLHYRANPDAGPALRAALTDIIKSHATSFDILAAKMAWEIRPAGIDKGTAVRAIMANAPFIGRLPIFIGDDVTDEDGIRAAIAMGGQGFRIPDDFESANSVRKWLRALTLESR